MRPSAVARAPATSRPLPPSRAAMPPLFVASLPPPFRPPARTSPQRPRFCACASGGKGGKGGRLPGGYSAADNEKKRIRWKDRVALQAQVGSALDTLQVLLEALRDNKASEAPAIPGDSRSRDEGLEALYAFANFDVWSIRTNFFGRALDLGQFERFKPIMVSSPFAITLIGDYEVLSQLSLSPDVTLIRARFSAPRNDDAVFDFTMSRVKVGATEAWMLDSFVYDQDASAAPPEDVDSNTAPAKSAGDR